jgi:hypothetical protein
VYANLVQRQKVVVSSQTDLNVDGAASHVALRRLAEPNIGDLPVRAVGFGKAVNRQAGDGLAAWLTAKRGKGPRGQFRLRNLFLSHGHNLPTPRRFCREASSGVRYCPRLPVALGFYVGEVKYKDEILPGEQSAIMDRTLFDAVQQKLTEQWTTRSTTRNASDHLLTGLLFDDADRRMVPTHATKANVRYRYYVSLPHLYGESKTASVGSVSRIPAADIEDIIVKSLTEHLIARKEKPTSGMTRVGDSKLLLEQVSRIDVYKDRLAIRLKLRDEEASDSAEGHSLSIPWKKPPSRKSRQILIPHGVPKNEVRPTRIERRARVVSAIARGRRWLDEIVSGSVTDVQQIAARQKCSVRQVNMTISLAFLAPDLVRAAVEGRLPRGISSGFVMLPPNGAGSSNCSD